MRRVLARQRKLLVQESQCKNTFAVFEEQQGRQLGGSVGLRGSRLWEEQIEREKKSGIWFLIHQVCDTY